MDVESGGKRCKRVTLSGGGAKFESAAHLRRPMMLGLVLFLRATPHMTWGRALFASTLSVYIAIGVALEERGPARMT